MKPLKRNDMITIITLADNNFIANNAAIDLKLSSPSISKRIGCVIGLTPELFTYRDLPKGGVNRRRIKGFTTEGYRFYNAAKYFMETLSEI